MRKKVIEVAKECKIRTNELVSYLREKNVDVKGASDYIDVEALEIVYGLYAPEKLAKLKAANASGQTHKKRLFDANGKPVKRKRDENGNPLPFDEPVFDENGRQVIFKKALFDANGNPVKRKRDENGNPLPFDEPVFDENGRQVVTRSRTAKKETTSQNENEVKKEAETAVISEAKKVAEEKKADETKAEPEVKMTVKEETVKTESVSSEKVEKKVATEEKNKTDEAKDDGVQDKENNKSVAADNKKSEAYDKQKNGNAAQKNEKSADSKGFVKKDRNNRDNSERNGRDQKTDFRRNRDNNGEKREGGFTRKDGENKPFNREQRGDRRNGYTNDRNQGDKREGNNERRRNGNSDSSNGFKKQGQGFSKPGFGGGFGGGFDKDKDSGERRTFAKKNDSRGSSSIKADLGKEISRDQRAAAFNERKKDKNSKKSRDYENEDGIMKSKKKDPNRKGAFIMPKPVAKKEEDPNEIKTIVIPEMITIKELSDKLKQNASNIVKKLFLAGKMVSINSEITFEEAEEIALEYNAIVEKEEKIDVVEELMKDIEDPEDSLVPRPPVICVMGHVDHGKTSILDAIRKTNVQSREAGGITQHIGAYQVEVDGKKITFLDTPGHEAFTAMRLRGAMSTDIAVLVVAADDGVMPQTVEAINHAKAAGVQIVVAINKMDREGANPDRVMTELSEHGLISEAWGGDVVMVPVSAKKGEGINDLLEMILLTADVLELKANPNRRGRGIVVEAKLDKGRGPVATVLVKKGTLRVGDNIAIGSAHGKVRAMINDMGRSIKEATPSMPVEILGLNSVPNSGDTFVCTETDKEARTIAEAFIAQSKEKLIEETKAKLSLDGLFNQIQAGNVKELNLIIKADVQGSVEAVKQSLVKLSNEEVAVRVIHSGAGNINESDVTLASASNAIIIGFNVKPDNAARESAEKEKVDLRLYSVIYNAIDDVEAAMNGMLDPIYEEKVTGHAEIRQIFKASGVGNIAGSYILDGKAVRGSKVRIYRDGELIHEGELASLKRFKDDVKEVAAGYECGLVFDKFNEFAEGNTVEFYCLEEVPRNREKKQR